MLLMEIDKTQGQSVSGSIPNTTFCAALLHKSGGGRGSVFPGQTYPTASVTGMPSAV